MKKILSVLLLLTVLTSSASALDIQLPKGGGIPSAGPILLAVTNAAGPLVWTLVTPGFATFEDYLDGVYGVAMGNEAGPLDFSGLAGNGEYVFLNYPSWADTEVECTDGIETVAFEITPKTWFNVTENLILTSVKYTDDSAPGLAAVLRSVGIDSMIETVETIYTTIGSDQNIYPDVPPYDLIDADLIGFYWFEPLPDNPDIPEKIDFIYPFEPDSPPFTTLPNIGNIHAYISGLNTTEIHYITVFGNAVDVPPSYLVEEKGDNDEFNVAATDFFYGLSGFETLDVVFKVGRLSLRDFNDDLSIAGCVRSDSIDAMPPHDEHGNPASYTYDDGTKEGATIVVAEHHADHDADGDGTLDDADDHRGHSFVTSGGLWLPIIGSLDIDMDADLTHDVNEVGDEAEFFCPRGLYTTVTPNRIAAGGGAYGFNAPVGSPNSLAGMSVRVTDEASTPPTSKWFYTIKDNGSYGIIMEDDAYYDTSRTPVGNTIVNLVNPSEIFVDGVGSGLVVGDILYFEDPSVIIEVDAITEFPAPGPDVTQITVGPWFDRQAGQVTQILEIGDKFVVVEDTSQVGGDELDDGMAANLNEQILVGDSFEVYYPRDMLVLFMFADIVSGPYRTVNTKDDAINIVHKQIAWLRQWYPYKDDADFWTNPAKAGWFANAGFGAETADCAFERHHMSMIEIFNTFDISQYVGSLCNGLNITKFIDNYINNGVPGTYNEYDFQKGADNGAKDDILDCVSNAAGYPGYGFLYTFGELPLGGAVSGTNGSYYQVPEVAAQEAIPFRTASGMPQMLPIVITNDGTAFETTGATGDFSSVIVKDMEAHNYVGEALVGQADVVGTADRGGGAIAFIGPSTDVDMSAPVQHSYKIKRGYFDLLGHQYLHRFPHYVARAYHRGAQYLGELFTVGLKAYVNSPGDNSETYHQWAYLRMNLQGCPAMPIPIVENWQEQVAEDHDVPALYVNAANVGLSGMRDGDGDGVGDFNSRDVPVFQVNDASTVTAKIQAALKGATMPVSIVFAVYDITYPYASLPPSLLVPPGAATQHTSQVVAVDGVAFDPNGAGGIVIGDNYDNALAPGPGVYMVRALISDNETVATQYIKEARFFFEVVNEPPTQTLVADYYNNDAVDDGTAGINAEILLVDDDEFKPLGLFPHENGTDMYTSPMIMGTVGYGFIGWYLRTIDYSAWDCAWNSWVANNPALSGEDYPWKYAEGLVTTDGSSTVTAGATDMSANDPKWYVNLLKGNIHVGDYIWIDADNDTVLDAGEGWFRITSIAANGSNLTVSGGSPNVSAGMVPYVIRMPFHRVWNTFASRTSVDTNRDGVYLGDLTFNRNGNAGPDTVLGTADDEGYHGEPTPTILNTYNATGQGNSNLAVIWSCAGTSRISTDVTIEPGDMINETLTWKDQDNLEVFLNQGGKLFVSGVDVAFDLDGGGNGQPFLENFLHVVYDSSDAERGFVTGDDNDELGQKFATISLAGGSGADTNGSQAPPPFPVPPPPPNYQGWIALRLAPDKIYAQATGSEFLTYTESDGLQANGAGGIKAYTGTSGAPATVFVPWNFEGIQEQNTNMSGRNVFLKECYNWLRSPSPTGTNDLAVVPASVSVGVGASWLFRAQGGSGTYSWAIVINNSGAPPLSSLSGDTVTYTAGGTIGADYIQLSDGTDTVFATVYVGMMSPDFAITADITSVGYEDIVNLMALGAASSDISWDITTNESGASLSGTTGTVIVYTSGTIDGIDTITATDNQGGGQATVNIVVSDVAPPPGDDDDDDDDPVGDPPQPTGGGGGGGCFLRVCKG